MGNAPDFLGLIRNRVRVTLKYGEDTCREYNGHHLSIIHFERAVEFFDKNRSTYPIVIFVFCTHSFYFVPSRAIKHLTVA